MGDDVPEHRNLYQIYCIRILLFFFFNYYELHYKPHSLDLGVGVGRVEVGGVTTDLVVNTEGVLNGVDDTA